MFFNCAAARGVCVLCSAAGPSRPHNPHDTRTWVWGRGMRSRVNRAGACQWGATMGRVCVAAISSDRACHPRCPQFSVPDHVLGVRLSERSMVGDRVKVRSFLSPLYQVSQAGGGGWHKANGGGLAQGQWGWGGHADPQGAPNMHVPVRICIRARQCASHTPISTAQWSHLHAPSVDRALGRTSTWPCSIGGCIERASRAQYAAPRPQPLRFPPHHMSARKHPPKPRAGV